jgi:hypothetical protein
MRMASAGIWERGREGLELGSLQKSFVIPNGNSGCLKPGPGVQNLTDRRELLDTAAQTSLTPHGVEKDYHGLWVSWPRTTGLRKWCNLKQI